MRPSVLLTAGLLLAGLLCNPATGADPVPIPSSSPLASETLSSEDLVVVRIRGRAFLPDIVRIQAGRRTRLIFQNEDAELHAFVPGTLFNGVNLNISGNGAPEFSDLGLRRVIIPGGGRAELRFVLEEPGRYPFVCDMPGHEMRATIVVERPAPP
jgi:plastocyanin